MTFTRLSGCDKCIHETTYRTEGGLSAKLVEYDVCAFFRHCEGIVHDWHTGHLACVCRANISHRYECYYSWPLNSITFSAGGKSALSVTQAVTPDPCVGPGSCPSTSCRRSHVYLFGRWLKCQRHSYGTRTLSLILFSTSR